MTSIVLSPPSRLDRPIESASECRDMTGTTGGTRHIVVLIAASPCTAVRLASSAVSANGDACVDVGLRRHVEILSVACGGRGVCDRRAVLCDLANPRVVAWLWLGRKWSRRVGV